MGTTSTEDATTADRSDDTATTTGTGPGFGPLVAVAGLLAVVVGQVARRSNHRLSRRGDGEN